MSDIYSNLENFRVFCDSEIVWMGSAIHATDGVIYIPYATANGQIGYVVRSQDGGQEEFIYLNATTDSDGDKPNVFVYQGTSGDPAHDGALHHYVVAEEFGPRFDEIELKPFARDAEEEWPQGTKYLYELSDGELFEDAEGRLFNRIGPGPVQGSVEIEDDEEYHAYWEGDTRVRPCPSGAA